MAEQAGIERLSPSMFIGASGKGLISFGSGQPDLPPPKQVFSCLPDFNSFKYGPVAGQPYLREALAKENKGFSWLSVRSGKGKPPRWLP